MTKPRKTHKIPVTVDEDVFRLIKEKAYTEGDTYVATWCRRVLTREARL